VQIVIDTATDTYQQALATLRAAYGYPEAEAARRVREEDAGVAVEMELSGEEIVGGWSDQLLYPLIAEVKPNAREVVRYIAGHAPEVPFGQVQKYFADHATHPIPTSNIGGTMTSVSSACRHLNPHSAFKPVERDTKRQVYVVDPDVAAGFTRAFEVADAHPERLRL
jgi:hypothetical protein